MLDIKNYLNLINKYNYALTKIDVPYMPNDFPNNYPIGKDMDIFVLSNDYNDICKSTKDYFNKYSQYYIKIIDQNNNWRLRIEENNKLHYQIDITINNELIKNKIKKNNYFILSLENEIKNRQIEYNKNPNKKHHKEWLDRINILNNDYFISKTNICIDDTYDIIIPFGLRCSNALALVKLEYRKYSLPFDYIHINNIKNLFECLTDDFKNFLVKNPNDNTLNLYNMQLGIEHLFLNFYDIKNENYLLLNKRIKRFYEILNSNKKICFIFSNEDYFYSESFRNNNQDFEYLIKIQNLLKTRYPNLHFNIININGVEKTNYENIKSIHVKLNNNKQFLNRTRENFHSTEIINYQNKYRDFLTLLIKKILKKPSNNFTFLN
jgi:hypothetical protein